MPERNECAMDDSKYEDLKQFIKDNLIGKYSVKDLVAEVFGLWQDYQLSDKQEMELYNIVDPKNEEWSPAELWYKDYSCVEMSEFVEGRIKV